ncbi:MAG: hypothetical protein WAT92_11400 [Saprospiraceae bacterium]
MKETKETSNSIQNDKLKIRVNSHDQPFPTADVLQKILQPRRLTSYFLVFIESGAITYNLDLQDIAITEGQLMFAMPNQVFVPPTKTDDLRK